MRDITLTKRAKDGTATFSIMNVAAVSGVGILAEKVTKAILQKNRNTPVQNFVGADAYSLAGAGGDLGTITTLRMQIAGSLKNIEQEIIRDTPAIAPSSSRLSKILLEDLFYDSRSRRLFLKVKVVPLAGSSETLSFPIDDRKW